jgi:hypothetical protein
VKEGSRLRVRWNCNFVTGSALNAVVDNLHEAAESFYREHVALLFYHLVNGINYIENRNRITEMNLWPVEKTLLILFCLARICVREPDPTLPESCKQGRSAEFSRRLEPL